MLLIHHHLFHVEAEFLEIGLPHHLLKHALVSKALWTGGAKSLMSDTPLRMSLEVRMNKDKAITYHGIMRKGLIKSDQV